MENMLIISPEFPFPPDGGGAIRLLNLLQIYSRYFNITLLSYYFGGADLNIRKQALLEWCDEVFAVETKDWRLVEIRSAIMTFITGVPFNSCKFIQKAFTKRLKELLQNGNYRHIVLEHTYMLPYTKLIRALAANSSTIILDAHNFETNLWRDRIKTKKGWRKLLSKYTYICMKKMEEKYVKTYDLVFTTSEVDLDCFKSIGVKNLYIVPNIVSCPDSMPGEPEEDYAIQAGKSNEKNRTQNSLIFCGILSYFPNREGVAFFYENIYRCLKSEIEGIKFNIVGKDPDSYIRSLGEKDSSIEVTGYVKDVNRYYKEAAVAVVPLLSGSGTRLKILDAFNNGTPVISTSKGCEGLEVKHLHDIYIANTPDEFIEGIKILLSNRTLRERIRQNAKKLVNTKYSKKAIEKHVAAILT